MSALVRYQGVNIARSEHQILNDLNVEIQSGEFIYLIGKVGSGKSTFIKSLYGEIPICGGEAVIFEHNLHKLRRKELPLLRRKLGIIFQDFQLLTDRNIHDNLEFVLRATGWKRRPEIEKRINEVLEQVGLQSKGYKMPFELSGGEQQRVVIARALLNEPELIIADEPTGNLDVETGGQIVRLLHAIRANGTAVLMCTHNLSIIERFPGKVLLCKEGHIEWVSGTASVPEEQKAEIKHEIAPLDTETALQLPDQIEQETEEANNETFNRYQ